MNDAISAAHSPISLYIHLPWCLHKCAYCDFNSHATKANTFPEQAYTDALINDLILSSRYFKHRIIQSIFIGGGTPSLFSPQSIKKILDACNEHTHLDAPCEITLETNPGTFEFSKFAAFLDAGINRLSIGVQSLNDKHLRSLERIHSHEEAIKAIETASNLGFNHINADLMYGLPEQTISEAQQDIDLLCNLPLTHISYYQLTLEPNTVFHRFPPQLPNEDDNWVIQTNGIDTLNKHGYQRYEVSAYALSGEQCLHNTNYWQYGDYLGIGAGAHSKLTTDNRVIRQQRTRQPDSYVRAVQTSTHVVQEHTVDTNSLIFEFMLNNLRLTKGFSQTTFTQTTGLAWDSVEPAIHSYINEGLMELDHSHYRATSHGYQYLDELTQRFLPTT